MPSKVEMAKSIAKIQQYREWIVYSVDWINYCMTQIKEEEDYLLTQVKQSEDID